jgi:30S ribosomal protein S31
LLFLLFIFHSINKIPMGRGDKKTKKGKIFMGSFGKSRPVAAKPKPAAGKAAAKKAGQA